MDDSNNPVGAVSDAGLTLPPDLEQFLDRIITEKFAAQEVPTDFINESKVELRPLLLKSINLAFFESLSTKDRELFSNLIESNESDVGLQNFFATHLLNPEQIMAETLLTFRHNYLG